MGVTLPLGDPMNIDSSALPTTTEKRPLNSISLDSDSEPDDHGMLSSTLIGTGSLQSKVTKFNSVPKKAFKMSASSTVHSSSAIPCNASGAKHSPSGQSSSLNFTNTIKAQTVKDLGNAIVAMKDCQLITPEESSSKLYHEATAIIMKDKYLLFKKTNACCHAHTT